MLKGGHVKREESLECALYLDLGAADISAQGAAEGATESGWPWPQAGVGAYSRALPADAVTLC